MISCPVVQESITNNKVLLILMNKEEKDEHLQVMAPVPLTLA